SLASDLQRLRDADSDVSTWIDAISISQQDTQERGQQVCIMHAIYANAAEVIAYLGE
ncbi:hypothetical protein BJ875DRAFT_364512, partial [Amylocarpus encephaloides]